MWATLRWGSGFHCYLHTNAAAHSGFRFEILVYTESAEIRFDLSSKLVVYGNRGDVVADFSQLPTLKPGDFDNTVSFFSGTFRHFADALVRGLEQGDVVIQDAPTFAEARRAVEMLEAIKASHLEGGSVQVGPNYSPKSLV